MKLKFLSFVFFMLMLPQYSIFSWFVNFAILSATYIYLRSKHSPLDPPSKDMWVYSVLIFLIVVSLLRSSNPLIPQWLNSLRSVYFFLYIVVIAYVTKIHQTKRTDMISLVYYLVLYPSFLFFALNIILWGLNVSPQISITDEDGLGESVFLSFFGIHTQRVQFPLAEGFNNYSAHVSFILSICLALLTTKPSKFYKKRIAYGTVICFATLLLIDSRSSIFLPIAMYCLLRFASFSMQKTIIYISIPLIILGPILLTILLPLLNSNSLLQSISRSDSDILTANSRTIIWGFSFLELRDFKLIHLIGYGDYGHFASNLSKNWESIFGTETNAELKTAHNTMISIVLDYGYIGLTIYLLIFRKLVGIFNRAKNRVGYSSIIFAVIFFNVFNGITETLFGFYFQNYISILLSIVLIIFLCAKNYEKKLLTDERKR